jgi:ferritin-like metal-binding protein YciE
MAHTIEISEDLNQRIDQHLQEDGSYAEFVEELVSVFETEVAFLQEGYSG